MFHNRMRTHANVVANVIKFSNHDAVAGLKTATNIIAGVKNTVRTYKGIRSNAGLQLDELISARRHSQQNQILKHTVITNERHLKHDSTIGVLTEYTSIIVY